MLETAPSLSIYNDNDNNLGDGGEEEEDKDNGVREEDSNLKKSLKIRAEIDEQVVGSGDFSFVKSNIRLIEENKEEKGEIFDGVEKLGSVTENSEEYYKDLVEEFPNHPQILINYAQFLKGKGDLQGAEEYYFRASKIDPGNVEILSEYAILVWELHHDQQKASALLKLAAQNAPYDSNVLAAYAKLLWEVDDDEDDNQDLREPVYFHPSDGIVSADAEIYYRRMIEKNPSDPLSLKNYAQFLYQLKGDRQGAEEYYSRFLSTNPPDGEMLLQYATLLWELYHDRKRTLSYMKLAVKATPEDCDILAAYARFLWSMDDEDDDGEP